MNKHRQLHTEIETTKKNIYKQQKKEMKKENMASRVENQMFIEYSMTDPQDCC